MQAAPAPAAAPAAAFADHTPDRYLVRPEGVLAELLGAAEFGEDELLLRLRELGLITYPSPLLEGLLERLPEVLEAEVLARLDPTDLVLFGQAGRACRAAVVAFGVQQAAGEASLVEGGEEEEYLEEADEEEEEEEEESLEQEGEEGESIEEEHQEEESLEEEGSTSDAGNEDGPPRLKFRVMDFVGSVERLVWAKERGCPWIDTRGPMPKSVCAYAADGGHLEVLKWASGGAEVTRPQYRDIPTTFLCPSEADCRSGINQTKP